MRSFCFSQALRVVDARDAADEAAQEAIVRAWRHRDSCRQPEQPFGWLRRNRPQRGGPAWRAGAPKEVLVDEPLALPDGRTDEDRCSENRLLFGAHPGHAV